MHTDKKEIIKFDLVLPGADFPFDVCIIFERIIFLGLLQIGQSCAKQKSHTSYFDETLHTFSDVLC